MAEDDIYLLVDPVFSLEAFQGVAYSMLLKPSGAGEGTRGVDYCERWTGEGSVVEWLEVGKLDCCFVRFISPDPKFVTEYLSETLDTKELSELLNFASELNVEHDDLVDLLYRIGYMAPKPSEEVLALFKRMIQDPRPTIRQATLNGYMIRRWPDLWERIVEIEATDPDEDVRATARKVLAHGVIE